MRRIAGVAISAITLALLAGSAWAQTGSPLGDYARAVRKEKRPPATKVYTNDNLPTGGGGVSVVGPSPEPAADKSEKTEDKSEKSSEKSDEKEKKDKPASEAKPDGKTPEGALAWREKFVAQNKKIADLKRELDLLEREYKLRVAAYYADAGWQLRDPKAWTEEEAKYRSDIADRQKQLEQAKAQLEDMKEQARQAGAPASVSE
jgi:hypothetical protein